MLYYFLDFIPTSEPEFIIEKKNLRLLRSKSMQSKKFAIKNMQINAKREKFKIERAKKHELSVKMYREYRIGDFPDIEITNASVIKPLVELAKVCVTYLLLII